MVYDFKNDTPLHNFFQWCHRKKLKCELSFMKSQKKKKKM